MRDFPYVSALPDHGRPIDDLHVCPECPAQPRVQVVRTGPSVRGPDVADVFPRHEVSLMIADGLTDKSLEAEARLTESAQGGFTLYRLHIACKAEDRSLCLDPEAALDHSRRICAPWP